LKQCIPQRIPLDNAAQIFPTVFSIRETTLSRIGMILDAPVDRDKMEEALASVIKRFPYYQVYLKKGLMSFYFERTEDIPPLEEDGYWTNAYVNFHKEQFLIRLKYSGNQITIESSHILTDGFGTLSFLYSLLAEYYRMDGIDAGESPFVFRPGEEAVPEEWECGYKNTFTSKGPGLKVPTAAFVPSSEFIPEGEYNSIRFTMDRSAVKALANEENATVYVFMTALYTSCLEEIYLEDIKTGTAHEGLPIRMQVPVNLRSDYPSRAMRNFSYVYSPTMEVSTDRGAHSHEDIVQLLSDQIRHERHSGSMEHQIARNLRAEQLMLTLKLPRFLKDLIFKIAYTVMARKMYSGVLTNLGEMTPPPGIAEKIKGFEILPCNSPVPGRNSALYSYMGKLDMNIGSSAADLRLEDKMEEKLKALNIPFELKFHR
jgi:hypothetical protein